MLFCVSALMPVRPLVEVVLFVLVDFLQAVDGMGIDEVMIIIEDLLPLSTLWVLVLLCSFPSRQCSIPLPAPELWFTSRVCRRSGVAGNIKNRDSFEVLLFQVFQLVLKWASMPFLGPGFPHRDHLDYDSNRSCGMFGQGHQSFHQCSGLVVWCRWCTCDGPKPLKLPQGHVMHTKAKDPKLIPLVVA